MRPLPFLGALLPLACGIVDTTPPDDPVALDDPVLVQEASCHRAVRCGDDDYLQIFGGGTLETCLAHARCSAEVESVVIPAGCARALESRPCGEVIEECQYGTGQVGAPCGGAGGLRCAQGLYCPSVLDACNYCTPTARLGESCAERICDRDLFCASGTDRCETQRPIGEACGAAGECLRGRCVDGRCTPFSAIGGPCESQYDCFVGDLRRCIGGICRPLPDLGEPCDGRPRSCRDGLACVDGTCAAVPCGATSVTRAGTRAATASSAT